MMASKQESAYFTPRRMVGRESGDVIGKIVAGRRRAVRTNGARVGTTRCAQRRRCRISRRPGHAQNPLHVARGSGRFSRLTFEPAASALSVVTSTVWGSG